MSLYAGREMTLAVATEEDATNFIEIGGMQSKSILLAAPSVESLNLTSESWIEGVTGAGVATARISATGAFSGDAASREAARLFMSQAHRDWRIQVAGLGTLTGPFKLTRLEFQASFKGEERTTLALQSTGVVSLTEEEV